MGSWLLKILSEDMKTKIENKNKQTKINTNLKAMGNMDHYPKNGQMEDTNPHPDISC